MIHDSIQLILIIAMGTSIGIGAVLAIITLVDRVGRYRRYGKRG